MVKFKLKKSVAKALVFAMAMGVAGVHGVSIQNPVAVMAATTGVTLAEDNPSKVRAGGQVTLTAALTGALDTSTQTVAWSFTAKDSSGAAITEGITITKEKVSSDNNTVSCVVEVGADVAIDSTITVGLKVGSLDKEEHTLTVRADQGAGLKIDYSDMTATISAGDDDHYVFLEVLKSADDAKPVVYPYSCSSEVSVDLSFLKISKDVYLRAYGDASKVKTDLVKIEKQAAKPKVKFNAAAKFEFEAPAGSSKNDTAWTAAYKTAAENYIKAAFGGGVDLSYQFKTLYGSDWSTDMLDAINYLDTAKIAGSTIIIRKAAVEDKTTDGTLVPGTPAGAEVKVKIPASPKAPKVKIDYLKNAITVKKTEYGIIDENGEIAWVTGDDTALSPKEILNKVADARGLTDTTSSEDKTDFVNAGLTNGFSLAVRTPADKKSASLPTFVDISAQPTITDNQKGTVTYGTNTMTYEYTDGGIKLTFTTGGFEWKDSTGKWKAAKSNTAIKGQTGALTIRLAGVKPAKDGTGAAFPSNEITINKPAPKTPAEKPTLATDDPTKVQVASTTQLTVVGGMKKVTFTLESEAPAFEYSLDNTTWQDVKSDSEIAKSEITANTSVDVYIRLKETDEKGASEAVKVTVTVTVTAAS